MSDKVRYEVTDWTGGIYSMYLCNSAPSVTWEGSGGGRKVMEMDAADEDAYVDYMNGGDYNFRRLESL